MNDNGAVAPRVASSGARGTAAGSIPSSTPAAGSPQAARRSTIPVLGCLALLLIAPMLGGCTEDLSCSGSDVQAALRQALDNSYTEARSISQIAIEIKDIISVGRSGSRISCKAVVHIDVTFLGIVQTTDPIIPYTAEITDGGQVLVTATP